MKINRWVSFVPLALIISLVLFPNVVALANAQKGKIAPDFEVVDLKGNTFKLSDFKGSLYYSILGNLVSSCWLSCPSMSVFSKNMRKKYIWLP